MKYRCKCGTPIDATVESNVCPNCGLAVKPENDISGGIETEQEKVSKRIDTIAKDGANAPRGSAPSDKKDYFKDRGQNFGEKPHREGDRSPRYTAKEHDYKNLEQIVKDYEINKDPSKIISLIASFDENIALLDIDGNWRPFLILAARAAVENENTELQNYLKNHAKDYDAKWKSGKLFYSMFLACPKLHLTNNEWMGLIKETGGDSAAFDKISEYLIQYIVETCDKSFAIDVFANLRKLSKKHMGWTTVCEGYARALFTSNAIADMVFTKEAFVKQGAARKFVKYCKARLHGGVSIEASRVWDNYVAACNVRRGRVLIGIASGLVVIIAAMIAFNVYLASVNKDTVSFTVDKMLEVTYGEKLSLDGYYLTYKTHGGEEIKVSLNDSMLVGYDPEAVGSQQSVYFEFHGVQAPVTVVVKATQLSTPVLTQSGHYITWETVPYAESYAIFVNASEVKTNETSGLKYDLSENPSFGALTVTVRAMSTSGKYISSEMSAPITVTKLEAPKNIEYSAGKLTWSTVEGATGYELTVNGIPYVATAPECTLSLNCGNNDITIIAKSSDKSVIPGVTVKNDMYYNQLDPITSMTYRDGTLSWVAGADAKMFRVYVDGVQWKDFSRNNFSFENDGFAQAFGGGAHKIEIVCMTSASGVENSDKVGYNVSFGNKTTISGGLVSWQNIGVGSTYFVYVNGVLHTYNDSYFSVSDCTWQSGVNEVSIVARLNGEEYLCESFTVKKHAAPTLSVTDTGWFVENSGYELYSVNGGAWTSTLPDISAIASGVHTVRAKRAVSAPDAFEIESDITEITVHKPVAPVIRLNMGVIECSTFDSETLALVLEYYDVNVSSWIAIDSVEALVHAGEYRLRAYFRAKTSVGGVDFCLSSDRSAELRARRPEAPSVIYNAVSGLLSSNTPGARFYYRDENGVEHEIPEGKVSNLPGGVFKVYARLNATDSNTLNSRNTPEQEQVSVFNLDIDFAVSPIAGSNQCYLLFSGCNDIDSITYSYKISYLDASAQVIGGLDRSYSFSTQSKTSPTSDAISCLINYRTGGVFNGNYTQSDVSKIEVIVYIDGGTETLQKSYTVSVK